MIAFTDLHMDDWKRRLYYTRRSMIKAVLLEKPDLIVFTGDIVTGGRNKRRLESFCRLMDRLDVYWAPVLGNHEGDNPKSQTREYFVSRMSKCAKCLLEAEDKFLSDGTKVAGLGNYAVSLAGTDGRPFETFFFLDTGDRLSDDEKERIGIPAEESPYDHIKLSQIEWYREMLQKQEDYSASQGLKAIPSVVFGHIPLPEFDEAYEKSTLNDMVYKTGEIHEESEWICGYRREGICSSPVNSGMFEAIRNSGSTKAFFCGHDHINDLVVRYKGIILGYIVEGSYSSYNVISKKEKIKVGKTDKLIQGYTLFTFEKGKEMQMEQKRYYDLFPELRKKVLKVIRK